MERFVRILRIKAGGDGARRTVRLVAEHKAVTAAGDSLKTFVERGAGLASKGYQKTGAKAVVDRASEKFDEVSGKAILEEVKLLVERQSVYNDVLATKLQEALDRISELEARVNPS